MANSVAEPMALPPHRSQSHATDLTASMATGNSRQPGKKSRRQKCLPPGQQSSLGWQGCLRNANLLG